MEIIKTANKFELISKIDSRGDTVFEIRASDSKVTIQCINKKSAYRLFKLISNGDYII